MKSKAMAFLAAGLALTAFTFVVPSSAEARSCNNNNNNRSYFNNGRKFKKFKRVQQRRWNRAFNNNNNNWNRRVNVNPNYTPVNSYFVPNNQVYGNVINPYYTGNGFMNTIRNLF